MNLFSINLDHDGYKNYQKKYILSNLENSIKNYEIFIEDYIKSDDNELSADKIIRILKNYEQKS